jgi:diaminopimelate decarboxylase
VNHILTRYERPSIVRHHGGVMNKLGTTVAPRHEDRIDGVPVDDLVAAYGSPCFVYSERTLRDKVRSLIRAFQGRWPRFEPAWSYKTCYLDAVCRVFHQEGSLAEAVSGMEVEKALRNGVPMHRIIFNGPHKDRATLTKALAGGALVHVDHFEELATVEQIADELGIVASVGIRLNMAAGSVPRWDRFGFDLDAGLAMDAVRRALAGGRIRLRSLHAHFGTFLLDPEAYRTGAAKVAAFANRLLEERGVVLDTIDLGGGFASSARLRPHLAPSPPPVPSFDAYADAIVDGLSALRYGSHPKPRLVLETGRALVDDAGSLITTVVAGKRLADGRRALVIDAGVNVLYTSTWYQHDLVPTRPIVGRPEPSVVFGPLCMNIDVVCENLLLPPYEAGDRLLVRPVGAYNVTQSMQFIHLRPAVVMASETGTHAAIRRAETLDDLTIGEQVPTFLQDRS